MLLCIRSLNISLDMLGSRRLYSSGAFGDNTPSSKKKVFKLVIKPQVKSPNDIGSGRPLADMGSGFPQDDNKLASGTKTYPQFNNQSKQRNNSVVDFMDNELPDLLGSAPHNTGADYFDTNMPPSRPKHANGFPPLSNSAPSLSNSFKFSQSSYKPRHNDPDDINPPPMKFTPSNSNNSHPNQFVSDSLPLKKNHSSTPNTFNYNTFKSSRYTNPDNSNTNSNNSHQFNKPNSRTGIDGTSNNFDIGVRTRNSNTSNTNKSNCLKYEPSDDAAPSFGPTPKISPSSNNLNDKFGSPSASNNSDSTMFDLGDDLMPPPLSSSNNLNNNHFDFTGDELSVNTPLNSNRPSSSHGGSNYNNNFKYNKYGSSPNTQPLYSHCNNTGSGTFAAREAFVESEQQHTESNSTRYPRPTSAGGDPISSKPSWKRSTPNSSSNSFRSKTSPTSQSAYLSGNNNNTPRTNNIHQSPGSVYRSNTNAPAPSNTESQLSFLDDLDNYAVSAGVHQSSFPTYFHKPSSFNKYRKAASEALLSSGTDSSFELPPSVFNDPDSTAIERPSSSAGTKTKSPLLDAPVGADGSPAESPLAFLDSLIDQNELSVTIPEAEELSTNQQQVDPAVYSEQVDKRAPKKASKKSATKAEKKKIQEVVAKVNKQAAVAKLNTSKTNTNRATDKQTKDTRTTPNKKAKI